MTKQEIIDAFEADDLGEVEFFELMLEAGVSLDEIGQIMQRKAQEDYMSEHGA